MQGLVDSSYENNREYIVAQRRFLRLAVFLGMLAALGAAFIQFQDAEYFVAAQSLIFPLAAPVVLLYQTRGELAYRRGLMFFALLTMVGQGLTTLLGLSNVVDVCWYAIFPLAYFLLLGPRRGLAWSLAGLGVSVAIYWALPWFVGYRPIDALAFLMAMLAYGVAAMLAWFHVHMMARYQRRLHQQVNYDHLTEALTRAGGIDLLQRYVNLADRDPERRLALAAFDLDDFKTINDVFGHDAGDRVLRRVATAVNSVIRKSDCLVRWGGEEFLVLLPTATLENARSIAEKLRMVVRTATRDMLPTPVTASVGVTVYRRGESISALLKRVDDLMYVAKRGGKDAVAHEDDAEGTPQLI